MLDGAQPRWPVPRLVATARFLAEVASARCGVYGPFDFGAARTLPFLPQVRHGRAVLAPARWLLVVDDLPAPGCAMPAWEKTLSGWRGRWHVPSAAGTLVRRLGSQEKRTLLAEFRTAVQPYANTTQIKEFDTKFGDLLRPVSA